MYNLIRSRPPGHLARETPTLFISVILAELFYKFGSFTFELIAFFITWYSLSRLASILLKRREPISHPAKNNHHE